MYTTLPFIHITYHGVACDLARYALTHSASSNVNTEKFHLQ